MQPPTDNLYKFLAIFGLLILGFSIYSPMRFLNEISQGNLRVDLAYQPMFEILDETFDADHAAFECWIKQEVLREKSEIIKPHECDHYFQTKENVASVDAKLKVLQAAKEKATLERNFLIQQYRQFIHLYIALGLFGFSLCAAGFWLWYVRLQRHLDAQVRRDASSLSHLPRRNPK